MRRLTRNAVKCLACGTTIESTHRHDYRTCGCPNGTMVDGGLSYQRWGAVDPSLVENLAEWTPENVETRCDHLGFDTVDPDDPGNDRGIFGKSVCPRCSGTGIIYRTPENVDGLT